MCKFIYNNVQFSKYDFTQFVIIILEFGNEVRYYHCKQNRGSFIPLKNLKPCNEAGRRKHYTCINFFCIPVVQSEIIDEVTDLLENETLPSTFTCEATGEPVPNISWYFNDSTLLVSDASKYSISNSLNGTVIKSLLTIVSAQSSDVGKYTCHAENIIGTDRSSGILTINGKFVC